MFQVGVHASRLSTALHLMNRRSTTGDGAAKRRSSSDCVEDPRTARLLLALVVPGHLLFTLVIAAMQGIPD